MLGAIAWRVKDVLPSDLKKKKVLVRCRAARFYLSILDAEASEALRVRGQIGPRLEPEY